MATIEEALKFVQDLDTPNLKISIGGKVVGNGSHIPKAGVSPVLTTFIFVLTIPTRYPRHANRGLTFFRQRCEQNFYGSLH